MKFHSSTWLYWVHSCPHWNVARKNSISPGKLLAFSFGTRGIELWWTSLTWMIGQSWMIFINYCRCFNVKSFIRIVLNGSVFNMISWQFFDISWISHPNMPSFCCHWVAPCVASNEQQIIEKLLNSWSSNSAGAQTYCKFLDSPSEFCFNIFSMFQDRNKINVEDHTKQREMSTTEHIPRNCCS